MPEPMPLEAEAAPSAAAAEAGPRDRPWVFAFLIAPIAVLSNGVISGALSLLLRRQGVSLGQVAAIVSLLNVPQTIYFVWSPITDFWILRRSWLMLASALSGVFLILSFSAPSLASRTTVIILFLSACLGQIIVSSCGGIMGTLRSEVSRRRASSFYQSGSLAFGALGVFVIALAVEHVRVSRLGWIVAAMMVIPSLAALAAPRQDSLSMETLRDAFHRIRREFRLTFWRWDAIPYTLIMLFPMGSGTAIGLLPGVASDYGVSASQVAWMNGLSGAALTTLGALAVTLIPTRVRAPAAYLIASLINEASLAVLWLGPLHPATYFTGAALFLLTVGACYALFTAVVLEFLGSSGKSGGTRYSIINSLGNVPVVYMAAVDAFGAAKWGTRGMTGADVIVGGIGGAALLIYILLRPPKPSVRDER